MSLLTRRDRSPAYQELERELAALDEQIVAQEAEYEKRRRTADKTATAAASAHSRLRTFQERRSAVKEAMDVLLSSQPEEWLAE